MPTVNIEIDETHYEYPTKKFPALECFHCREGREGEMERREDGENGRRRGEGEMRKAKEKRVDEKGEG